MQVEINPSDSNHVVLNLGIDLHELEETWFEPSTIDFDEQSRGEITSSSIPLEAFNDDGLLDITQLNLLYDPDVEFDIDLDISPPRERKRAIWNSDSEPESFDNWFNNMVQPKPDIYTITADNSNLSIYNIMNSLSSFYTNKTKTIEV